MSLFLLRKKNVYKFANYIAGIESANLIAVWPMDELVGSVSDNAEGTAARDGAYTGVTLGQNQNPFICPLFDGANDYNDIYTASLASAFSGVAGTAMLFFKVSAVGVWTNGTNDNLFTIRADANNYIFLRKSNTNNRLQALYSAGATLETVNIDGQSSTGWYQFAITWDKAADQVKAYLNGSQSGATQTLLGIWAGAPGANNTNIGSYGHPANVWDGYISHPALWSKALSATNISNIYQESGI